MSFATFHDEHATFFYANIIIISCEFFTPTLPTSFHWSLSDSKPPQISITLLNILAEWSWFFLWFPIVPVIFPSSWGPFQAHQLQLVSRSPSCSTALFSSLTKLLLLLLLVYSLTVFHTRIYFHPGKSPLNHERLTKYRRIAVYAIKKNLQKKRNTIRIHFLSNNYFHWHVLHFIDLKITMGF